MINYEQENLLTVQETCQLLGRSTESVRQLIHRKVFSGRKIGNRLYLDKTEVHNYFPNKYKLPPFMDLTKEQLSETRFYSLEAVQDILNYSTTHLRNLIKKGKLVAYATIDGQILIDRNSLDKYIMGQPNEADEL